MFVLPPLFGFGYNLSRRDKTPSEWTLGRFIGVLRYSVFLYIYRKNIQSEYSRNKQKREYYVFSIYIEQYKYIEFSRNSKKKEYSYIQNNTELYEYFVFFLYIYIEKNTIFAQFNKRKNIPYNEYSEKCLFSIYRNIHAATLLFVLTLLPILLYCCLCVSMRYFPLIFAKYHQ